MVRTNSFLIREEKENDILNMYVYVLVHAYVRAYTIRRS